MSAIITLMQTIDPVVVAKSYSLIDGEIDKKSVASITRGVARSHAVPDAEEMMRVLAEVTARNDTAIVTGYFDGLPDGENVEVVTRKALARLLGVDETDDERLAGLHEFNGKLHAARLNVSITPGSWALLDFDNPPGMPEEWAVLGIAERLAMMERVLPGIFTCERIELRSSSSRVVRPSGSPGPASHAWVRLSDAQKVVVLRGYLRVQTVLEGLSFVSPQYDRKRGEELPRIDHRTLFDLGVFSPERLVFCAKPQISAEMVEAGYTVADADVRLVNAGNAALDVSKIELPTTSSLRTYKDKTGEELKLSVNGSGLRTESHGALQWDTPITSRGVTKTLKEWVEDMPASGKIRCEAPFRSSHSEAAFISLGSDGKPFVYDSCGGIKYVLPMFDGPGATGVTLDHFRAYMPAHNYIFAPTGEPWPASSVNARLEPVPLKNHAGDALLDKDGNPRTQKASAWLDENRAVEQMTWAPGLPQVIQDKLVSDGGWRQAPGFNVFNLYRPPLPLEGDPAKAKPWLEHVRTVYPEDAGHLIRWLAHRVQRPHEKINHAIVLGGSQGIGKDTILEGVKAAIGPWNFAEVSPQHLLGRFNGFVKSVILRVSEARDLGDVDRFAFYDHMKTYTAAPPDVLRVDEKHLREYAAFNVCGVIITTNHKTDGIYLPADDRRHYVAWSPVSREAFSDDYWSKLYGWYQAGGIGHVAAYLRTLDLSGFNAKAPPAKTPAFWDIVSANSSPEDAELADALDHLGHPHATTIASIAVAARDEGFRLYLLDRRNSRKIPHRLEQCGYVPVRNPDAQDGLWKVTGKRCAIYARRDLAVRDQHIAAQHLAGERYR